MNRFKNNNEEPKQKRDMSKLKKIMKDKIRKETGIINQVIEYIHLADIGSTKDLIYAGAWLVALETLQKGVEYQG